MRAKRRPRRRHAGGRAFISPVDGGVCRSRSSGRADRARSSPGRRRCAAPLNLGVERRWEEREGEAPSATAGAPARPPPRPRARRRCQRRRARARGRGRSQGGGAAAANAAAAARFAAWCHAWKATALPLGNRRHDALEQLGEAVEHAELRAKLGVGQPHEQLKEGTQVGRASSSLGAIASALPPPRRPLLPAVQRRAALAAAVPLLFVAPLAPAPASLAATCLLAPTLEVVDAIAFVRRELAGLCCRLRRLGRSSPPPPPWPPPRPPPPWPSSRAPSRPSAPSSS